MKKKTLGRIALCAFALCLVSTALLSKTLAKFIVQVDAYGTITVAKFTDLNFKKTSVDELLTLDPQTSSFDLSDTKDTNNSVNPDTIAPGDQGSFTIVLGSSEVSYEYTLLINSVGYEEGYESVPINFYQDDTYLNPYEQSAANIEVSIEGENSTTREITRTIYWKWDTEAPNEETDYDIDYEDLETRFNVELSATQTMD